MRLLDFQRIAKKMNNFAVVILTHGRPNKVFTYSTLRKSGYTGDIYLLVDDMDKCMSEYIGIYGDKVLSFSKSEIAGTFDKMDNFGNMATVTYARNAVFDVCRNAGLKYICVMDDDYTKIEYRITGDGGYYAKKANNCDSLFGAYVDFLKESGVCTICFSQGGDFMGGGANQNVLSGFKLKRKMMNVYFFDVDKGLKFSGMMNEDLTSSITNGVVGKVILTSLLNSVTQKETQSNPGGLTDLYLEMGTYVKSFYSVIAAPSCVKIAAMGESSVRIHHSVSWKNAVPKILRESVKRAQ